jgi:hypothetical protein
MPEEVGLPLFFGRPRPQIPFQRFPGDSDYIEKFEKVILHMAQGAGRELGVGGKPVELTGTGAVETDFDRGLTKGGEKGGFEIALQIQDYVKWPLGKFHGHFYEAGQAGFSFEKKDFIHRRVPLNQRGPGFLKEPGDAGLRALAFDGVDDGKGVYDIPHRAEEDDADAGFRREIHLGGKSSRQRAGISLSELPKSPQRARLRRERRRRFLFEVST